MDASLLIRQSKELDFNPKLFVGGAAGFTLPEFAANAGEAAEYVFSADLWSPTLQYPNSQADHDKDKAKFGMPPDYHGAEAHASMYVVADVLKRAKELTPQAVREALVATDMMTLFGPVKFISYGKKTQQNELPTYLVQWQKGVSGNRMATESCLEADVYPVPPWSARK